MRGDAFWIMLFAICVFIGSAIGLIWVEWPRHKPPTWSWFRFFNTRKCKECGCREFYHEPTVIDQGMMIVLEESIRCIACRNEHNFWAYGSYQHPRTHTEAIRIWWNRVLLGSIYDWKLSRLRYSYSQSIRIAPRERIVQVLKKFSRYQD
jgi:predicted nucleic-acid-binding Zn-ribbon protein